MYVWENKCIREANVPSCTPQENEHNETCVRIEVIVRNQAVSAGTGVESNEIEVERHKVNQSR